MNGVASAPEELLEQARAGRIAEAEAGYRTALAASPDNAEALNFVGICAMARGELAEAQRLLRRASELEPEQPEIWQSLGLVHLGADRASDALAAFERALQLDPDHFVARLHRGAAIE